MSGSAKAGTPPRGTRCERRIWRFGFLRAPQKRASGELFFLLTLTYMDVGKPEVTCLEMSSPLRVDRHYQKPLFSTNRNGPMIASPCNHRSTVRSE